MLVHIKPWVLATNWFGCVAKARCLPGTRTQTPLAHRSHKYTFIIFKYTNLFLLRFPFVYCPLLRLLYSDVVLRRSMRAFSFSSTFIFSVFFFVLFLRAFSLFSLRWRLSARVFTYQIKYTIYSVYDFSCAWPIHIYIASMYAEETEEKKITKRKGRIEVESENREIGCSQAMTIEADNEMLCWSMVHYGRCINSKFPMSAYFHSLSLHVSFEWVWCIGDVYARLNT